MEHLWKLRLLKSVSRTIRIKSVQNLCSASCTHLLHSGFVQKQPQISLPVVFQVRSYAKKVQGKKGGKQKHVKLSDEEMAEVIDIAEYKAQLRAAVDKLKKNYVENLNLRWTGSNVGNLRVKLQDEEFALHELARISRKNPQLVVLNMSEFPEVIKHVVQPLMNLGVK
ncbi:Ribosome-recycling factor like protein [Argiope bruennichi]|uniref:Ribosome-recycling factor, mitochondrial n=1 Tax=Argiope bruennichi TaxID=94029 RepID=A0A8T0FX26_ARGBR|nr:Ribosome-recycling factor like protein [Argiope bruennichi]